MSTPYSKLYQNILFKFKDYNIPVMTDSEVKEYLHDFLLPAIVKFHVCKTNLLDRDDDKEVFNSDLTDSEIEILSNFMIIEYTDSEYIRTPSLLKVNLSSTDFNAFSPANHLDKLLDMHDTFIRENESLLMKYSWNGVTDKSKSILSVNLRK
ncbi:MAG: hypothetical protein UFN18_01685 [Ruminococcus sp.]|jgi:hypothetical protein|nr:hypothetical protein [Ruminococcus sp.]DAP58709.1 MAG TPA: hypothetical protein [Caudoviricetes sp.]